MWPVTQLMGVVNPSRGVVGLLVDLVHEPVLGDVASDRLEPRHELLRADPALDRSVVVEVLRVVLLHRREVQLQARVVAGELRRCLERNVLLTEENAVHDGRVGLDHRLAVAVSQTKCVFMPNWCMACEKARLSVPSMHEKTRSTPAAFIFCTSAVGDPPMLKLRSSNPRW